MTENHSRLSNILSWLKNHPGLSGVLTGLAVTVLCTVYFFLVDPEQKLELQSFDLRVRNFNTVLPSPLIVHIDINDSALERVGRWPWRRERQADLILTLDELGARAIVIDLDYIEREEPYFDDPRVRGSDVEPDVKIVGEFSEANKVYGDRELAHAFRSAPNVYLAMQIDVVAPNEPDRLRRRLLKWWHADKSITPDDVIEAFGFRGTRGERVRVRREFLRLRIRDLLVRDFTLTDQQLADALKFDRAEISAVLAGVKRAAADELVAGLFGGGETPTFDAVCEAVLGERKDRDNADREEVRNAYRRQKGLVALDKTMHPLRPDVSGRLYRSVSVTPPHFYLIDAARGGGLVKPSTDIDFGVRRVPIVISHEGKAVPHLGLSVASDILNLNLGELSIDEQNNLIVPYADKPGNYSLPLDENGNFIIHWTKTGKDWTAGVDFPHISAGKVWDIVDKRRNIQRNETQINYILADVIDSSKGELEISQGADGNGPHTTERAAGVYYGRVVDQGKLDRTIHLARIGEQPLSEGELRELEARSKQLREIIKREQDLATSNIELACQAIDQLPPEEQADDPEVLEFKRAQLIIEDDITPLREANQRLEENIRSLKEELGKEISGKYVFLGFAATAQGDLVPTPIDPLTNGVMCHANVLNSLLQRRFITKADRSTDVLICIALGAVVSVITASRSPRFALLATLGLMVAYFIVNAEILFKRFDLWLALIAPLGTCFVTWAIVTLFRQLTAEREKRFFAKQLSQYTSPAIAARIAESPEAARAFKTVQTREVTCFFSDLQGFTTITEQEDAGVVQHVLNVYLERMCQAIWSQRGLINKFMGDGIMAFFNPSVDPLPDHPRVASETTLITINELERLKAEQKEGTTASIFDKLHMRVGVATGLCKNGDFGSELKADYTVIGDVVNLAARLEPANKVFGTQIMVSGPTREVVKDLYEFRYLAELQVKGKARTVPVYELVCRKGELTDEQREYINRFEAGVALYKQKKWDECIVHFTRLLARKFDDIGASRYIDACQEFKAFPPDDDWNGALELKEK